MTAGDFEQVHPQLGEAVLTVAFEKGAAHEAFQLFKRHRNGRLRTPDPVGGILNVAGFRDRDENPKQGKFEIHPAIISEKLKLATYNFD